MASKRKDLMGPVAFYVYVTATSSQSGKRVRKMGPYASRKEAELKQLEEEEAPGTEGYEYQYEIRAEPSCFAK